MLIVVVPYVPYANGGLSDYTRAALFEQNETKITYVDLLDPVLGYGKLVATEWKLALEHGDDLCFVEQDIEVGPTTIYDFRACQHPYCGNPYPWTTNVGVAMGCTRFRHAFIAAHPTAVDQALAIAPHFRQFDVVFQRRVLAAKYGAQPHVHSPVIHHNPEKQLREGASPIPSDGVPSDDIGSLL
jgi:hypothetical protein